MDKQQEAAHGDSISSVGITIKPQDYPPSEVYSTEPPPAYVRPKGTAIQIARIAAVTLVAVSFILGFFMVASAYVAASASCYQDYPIQQENMEDRPTYQHLIDPVDPLEETADTKRESVAQPASQTQEQPIQVKLPLQLDFDELAGSMIEKNQRSRMNCVVEKRRAEEVMDHQPKTVRLPFGVNLTTEPRFEHVTGERMAIFCESGNDQSEPKITVTRDVWDKGVHLHQEKVIRPRQAKHVPVEHVPMMIPIHVHQVPLPHPNAIPHPMHHQPIHPMFRPQFHHQMPQQQQVPHMKFPPQIPAQMIPEEQVIIQEEVIPVFHPRPEGRSLEHHPVDVPSENMNPPPIAENAFNRPQGRPHFVQPRSVRSIETVLKRDKRVRRCACDCAC